MNYKNIYKKIVLVTLLLVVSTTVVAQPKHKKERIKALKTAYITEELDLTANEAEKFWPIYNAAEEKLYDLHTKIDRNLKRRLRDEKNIDNLTEEEAETFLNQLMEVEEQRATIKNKMYNDLKGIISAKKIIKLHRAERGFNRRLLKEFRKREVKDKKMLRK